MHPAQPLAREAVDEPATRDQIRFAPDSPPEEDGFELPVPPKAGGFSEQASFTLQLAKPLETEVFDPRGTGGSNPSFSSGESRALPSPAMTAGVSDRRWAMEDVVVLITQTRIASRRAFRVR
jgi:hypothetical protein